MEVSSLRSGLGIFKIEESQHGAAAVRMTAVAPRAEDRGAAGARWSFFESFAAF